MASSMEIHVGNRKTGSRRKCRLPRGLISLLLGLAVLLVAGGSGGVADERVAFVNLHRCEVAGRLARVEATTTLDGMGRFIVVALEENGQSYVQCVFDEDGGSLLCEASSGFYGPAEGEAQHLRLSPPAIAALGQLGFDTGVSEGNFQRVLALSGDADFDSVATFLLTVLYDGYGARKESRLEIKAPLARGPGVARCTPVE